MLVIKDWTCWVMPSGIRAASPNGKGLVNLFSISEFGLAVSDVRETLQAPLEVVHWLLETTETLEANERARKKERKAGAH